MLAPGPDGSAERGDILATGNAEQVLATWDTALGALLEAEDLDGLATALYTVGGPVRMEGLFDAYAAAAGTKRSQPGSAAPDQAAALSAVLETLADLGVVELGTEESAGGLTVALSPLGVWGVHRRLRAQGWHVPVLGGARRSGAAGLLITLASCDAEDGEAEISSWLAERTPAQAAAELVEAAGSGSPGLRGAAFAVLDRIGEPAIAEVRARADRAGAAGARLGLAARARRAGRAAARGPDVVAGGPGRGPAGGGRPTGRGGRAAAGCARRGPGRDRRPACGG